MSNEHDITKMMLETIRKVSSLKGGNTTSKLNRLITENEDAASSFGSDTSQVPTSDGAIETSFDETNDSKANDYEEEEVDNTLETPEAKEEISKITQMVDPLVNVKTFKIYEDSGNVVMSGSFQNADIEWQFSKNDGLFINAKNLNLTDNVKEMLDKLSAYYTNWQKEWAGKIGEYIKNK